MEEQPPLRFICTGVFLFKTSILVHMNITGTNYCNEKQLAAIKRAFQRHAGIISVGIYSNTFDIGVVASDQYGTHTTYISKDGIIKDPYEHLKYP